MRRDDDALRQAMRGEAGLPPFSPDLHERLMRAVRREDARPQARARHLPWRWPAALATAAAAAVVLGLTLRPTTRDDPAPVTLAPPDVPALQLDELIAPVRAELASGKFAYLDRDGRRFAAFLARQFPALPADADRNESS